MDAFAKIVLDMGDCYAVLVLNFLVGFVLFSFSAYRSWGISEGISSWNLGRNLLMSPEQSQQRKAAYSSALWSGSNLLYISTLSQPLWNGATNSNLGHPTLINRQRNTSESCSQHYLMEAIAHLLFSIPRYSKLTIKINLHNSHNHQMTEPIHPLSLPYEKSLNCSPWNLAKNWPNSLLYLKAIEL